MSSLFVHAVDNRAITAKLGNSKSLQNITIFVA